jgi:alcohol dehydrogenase
MKAAFIRKFGGNDRVEIGDVPMPAVGPEDLLVQVRAASVNPIDFKIRDGLLQPISRYRLPLVLGCDLCGEVREVGAKVTTFKPGDVVYARLDKKRIGAFAEYAAVRASDAAIKPARLDFVTAASVPLAGLTAWQALTEVAKIQPGHKVLIQSGSGGVGTLAIQLAKLLGAHVATTVGERNVEMVRVLGADEVIDYRKDAFDAVLSGYDMVFDMQGGDFVLRAYSVLKPVASWSASAACRASRWRAPWARIRWCSSRSPGTTAKSRPARAGAASATNTCS